MAVDRRRRLAMLGASLLVVLVVAELGARVLDDRLRDPLVWHTYEAQKKVGQMDDLADVGGADIVFIGHSMTHTAVVPELFTATLGTSRVAYNAALSSAIGRQSELWVDDVVVPRLDPELLVIGVCSYDLTDTGQARTTFYEAFRDSLAARLATGTASPLERVDDFLRDHSALWANRFLLRQPRMLLDAVKGSDPEIEDEVAAVDEHGHSDHLQDINFGDFPIGDVQLDVTKWTPGRLDRDALGRLIRDAKGRGIQVVLVDLPVTDDYVVDHPHGQADYEYYLAVLREFATASGVPLFEFNTIRDRSLFADELHLNRAGEQLFTVRLAEALRPVVDALPQ